MHHPSWRPVPNKGISVGALSIDGHRSRVRLSTQTVFLPHELIKIGAYWVDRSIDVVSRPPFIVILLPLNSRYTADWRARIRTSVRRKRTGTAELLEPHDHSGSRENFSNHKITHRRSSQAPTDFEIATGSPANPSARGSA